MRHNMELVQSAPRRIFIDVSDAPRKMTARDRKSQLGKQLPPLQDVLDLDRAVEGQLRPGRVHRPDDRHRMPRSVEKIGVGEGDVAHAPGDQALDVGQHDLSGHDEEAAAIDRGDRAVPADVQATPGGLHRGGRQRLPSVDELCVALDAGQLPSRGRREVE